MGLSAGWDTSVASFIALVLFLHYCKLSRKTFTSAIGKIVFKDLLWGKAGRIGYQSSPMKVISSRRYLLVMWFRNFLQKNRNQLIFEQIRTLTLRDYTEIEVTRAKNKSPLILILIMAVQFCEKAVSLLLMV